MAKKSCPLTRLFVILCENFLTTTQVDKMFKTPEAPNRVEPMLRSVQLKEYTDAVSDLAVKSLGKLFITSAFQKST